MRVNTANGNVVAQGIATASVGTLGEDIDVVVMQGAPRLLSVGQLVRQGHALQWGPGGCTLRTPAGRVIDLHVVNGIPMLPEREQTEEPAGTSEGATAHVGAVRDGVAEAHHQAGHYPWRDDCAVCNDAALRHAKHQRRIPHAGVLAVDLAMLGPAGPHVLVGATQLPGWTYAEPVKGKSADSMHAPLLRMIQNAKQRGEVTTVQADREAGIGALE